MRVPLCVVVFLAVVGHSCSEYHDWDMAVAVGDKIEFLDQNATLVGIAHQVFHNLKAITFDDARNQFVVSDMNEENDTIYKIRLSDTKNAIPIIKNLRDDVVDVAVDPVEDTLYWIDSLQKKIMKLYLNDTEAVSETLFEFKDQFPQGLAIDSCRRKIYWSNGNYPHPPSIERANLDGSGRETIITGNLFMPTGIVIDQAARRLYWTDIGEGIYFRIESSKLDGSNRKIVYEDTHQQPYRITLNNEYLFWADLTNFAIWGLKKDETGLKPEIKRRFNEKPRGLVTKNHDFKNMPECLEVLGAITKFEDLTEDIIPANDSIYCLNYGEFTTFGCKCSRGFTGPRCEINLCHNLCFTGICYQSSQGYPKCRCPKGYMGERCEIETCKNFCLNGGVCISSLANSSRPNCQCKDGFTGIRCERTQEPDLECLCADGVVVRPNNGGKPYCSCPTTTVPSGVALNNVLDPEIMCPCEDGIVITPLNGGKPFCSCSSSTPPPGDYHSALQQSDHLPFTSRLQDPLVMTFFFISIILLLFSCTLSIAMCKLRHRRPRIKKRIIVNKNVTPLTCRPNPPAEQCEITIENCCNMNICETPCFEPTSFGGFQRNKTEEKKTLLTSMENGEDLY